MLAMWCLFVLALTISQAIPTISAVVPPKIPKECTKAVADIMFLLDGSTSVGEENFIKMENFVKNIVSSFHIAKDSVRVGVVTYSHYVSEAFDMKKYDNLKTLLTGIGQINYPTGLTYTSEGLNHLRTISFKSKKGDRKGVPNIAIVVTDGKSSDPDETRLESETLKSDGVTIFSIGIGKHVNMEELTNIASQPTNQFRFTVNNFDALQSIMKQIVSRTCKTVVLPSIMPKVCTKAVADIMFLLDESSSIGKNNFTKVKNFVKNIVGSFHIAKDGMRVGVVTYSHYVYEVFDMNKYDNLYSLRRGIEKVKYHKGLTYTNDGLNELRKESFQMKKGDRKDVPNIAIVITDGKSIDPQVTRLEAETLKSDGVIVFSIGIGDHANMEELTHIASQPTNQFRFTVKKFDALQSILKQITSRTCNTAVLPPPIPKECTKAVADIMFLLDGSTSVGDNNFIKMKNFVKNIVSSFHIAKDGVRVGVVTYSHYVSEAFDMKKYDDLNTLRRAIGNIRYPKGLTYTSEGLNHLRTISFGEKKGDRKGVHNIAIIVTDGKSSDAIETKLEAETLKSDGVTVFSIGIGNQVNIKELTNIASQPTNQFRFTVNKFNALNSIMKQLATGTCKTAVLPPPMPKVCTKVVADIMFLLDESSSIGKNNFIKVKNFVKNIIGSFPIAKDGVRVGVVTYSHHVTEVFDLNKYNDLDSLRRGIDHAKYHKGLTYTSEGLNHLRKKSFQKKNGDRKDAPNIAIVITDGKSNDQQKTRGKAEALKKSGVVVFSIGIGSHVNKREITDIASRPTKLFRFTVDNFEALDFINKIIATRACTSTKNY